jgi:hypothetical protein
MAIINERQWKTPGDLYTSYRNLESLTGLPPERIVKLPGAKDAPEAWGEVFTRLGKPAKAEEYKIDVPQGADPNFAKEMAPLLHGADLTQAQAAKLAAGWNKVQEAKAQQVQAEHATQAAKLKSEWGGEFDKKAALVDKAATQFGMTAEMVTALKNAVGPYAAMNFLHNIGAKLGVEASHIDNGNPNKGFGDGLTPDQARARISELRQDKDFAARFASNDPVVRAAAREESRRLHLTAYGTEGA